MRGLALAAALVWSLALMPPPPARAAPRALVAFLPYEEDRVDRPGLPLLDELARRQLAVGLTSPTLGGYSDRQMALDVSQGTRVAAQAYDRPLELFDLVDSGGGAQIGRFASVAERARRAPGNVIPGLMGETVLRAGRRVGYAGVIGEPHYQAVVAASRRGAVRPALRLTEADFGARTLALWRDVDVLVARLPRDQPGLAALDRLLAAREPQDLVYVVRSPPEGRLRLLESGVAGLGSAGGLITSATTRRPGLVAATDVAPSVLGHLRLAAPPEMQGRPLEARPGDGPAEARRLAARVGVVVTRRLPAVTWFLGGWLVLLGALVVGARAAGARAALRILFLAALWSPGVLLATAALAPPRLVEMVGLSAGSLALGAVTDRLVRWPLAPALPAALVFCAHTLDLAAGSPLIVTSLAGPNPMGGARYFGIGNELETMLSVSVLLGTGAALTAFWRGHAPWGFAIASLAAAIVLGAGRLGADVGAVITLAAGGVVAVLVARGRRPSARVLALALSVPVAGLAALVAIDIATGGGAHLTRSVVEAGSPADLVEVVERRMRLSISGLTSSAARVNTVMSVSLIALGVWRRRELVAPLEHAEPFRAGLVGALAAVVVGALANDSGPVILFVGTLALVLAVAYVQAGARRPSRRIPIASQRRE